MKYVIVMTDIVVDTNVFLSLLLQQDAEHTQYANKIFNAILDADLNICVPVHFNTELGAVLIRSIGTRQMALPLQILTK